MMIRKLMASSALLALISAGAVSIATAQDNKTTKPVIVEETTTDAAADTTANEDKLIPERPTVASAFIGRAVYSSADPESDSIGDVNDLVIGEDGSITAAVVGVGGFLGIGEKNVAVPFDELEVVERDGEIRLIYSATREQLEAAPAIDMATYDPAVRYAEQQAALNATQPPADPNAPLAPVTAPTGDLAAQPAAPTQDMAAAPAKEPAEDMTAAPAEEPVEETAAAPAAETDQQLAATEAAPATDLEAGFLSAEAGQIRASTLLGKQVFGAEDESIGEVSDLVLEKEGATRAALIDVGGFLGVGEKTVAIPFDQLQFAPVEDGAEPKVTVAMTKEQLDQLPTYQSADETAAIEQPLDATPAVEAPATGDVAATETPVVPPATGAAPAGQMAAADQANPDEIVTGALGTGVAFVPQELAASELMGARVYGSDDADLGEISDIVFDESGEIDAVVVDVGGFLGIGEKPVALDFSKLNVTVDDGGNLIVAVSATQEQLDQAPSYEVSMQ